MASAQPDKPLRNVGFVSFSPSISSFERRILLLVEKNLKLSGNRIRLRLKSGMSTRSDREEASGDWISDYLFV